MSYYILIATDIYIPAMPQIAKYFDADSHSLQMTLSIYLIGLAISQIFYGPLSDRFGRKPIALIGCVVFTLSTILCTLATSVSILILARLLQALGAGAGMTVGRAIVGDVYSKTESAKIFATIFPFVGLSPAIAPVIGGLISSITNWQFVFLVVVLAGLLLTFLILRFLPETKLKAERVSIHPKSILNTYRSLLREKIFWGYTLVPSFAYIAYFSYIAESPFVFNTLHYTTRQIGLFYISLSISYLIGNFIARKLINHRTINQVILIGHVFFIFGGLLMLFLNMTTAASAASLIIPATFLTLGNGFLLPMGTAGVMSQFPKVAGYASGLLGFFQLGIAAISTGIVGIITNGNPLFLSWYVASATIISVILFTLLVIYQPKEVKNVCQF